MPEFMPEFMQEFMPENIFWFYLGSENNYIGMKKVFILIRPRQIF